MGFQKGFKRSPENIMKQRETRRLNSEKRKKERELVENPQPIQKNIVSEINLKQEFGKMTETINPKKKESDEPKYQCGACGAKFNDKMKYCPGCGVEFS